MSKILIPFFIMPMSILQEINISYNLNKKILKPLNAIKIKFLLNKDSINSQLIPADFFRKNKFRTNWPYTGII